MLNSLYVERTWSSSHSPWFMNTLLSFITSSGVLISVMLMSLATGWDKVKGQFSQLSGKAMSSNRFWNAQIPGHPYFCCVLFLEKQHACLYFIKLSCFSFINDLKWIKSLKILLDLDYVCRRCILSPMTEWSLSSPMKCVYLLVCSQLWKVRLHFWTS